MGGREIQVMLELCLKVVYEPFDIVGQILHLLGGWVSISF